MYLITYGYKLRIDKTLDDFEACIQPFITMLKNHSVIFAFTRLDPKLNIIYSSYIVKDIDLWLKYAKGPKAEELLMFLKDIVYEFIPSIKITGLLKRYKFEIHSN